MTTLTPAEQIDALRAELVAAEREWDRLDAHGDPAAAARVAIDTRIRHLRAAIAKAEPDQQTTTIKTGVH